MIFLHRIAPTYLKKAKLAYQAASTVNLIRNKSIFCVPDYNDRSAPLDPNKVMAKPEELEYQEKLKKPLYAPLAVDLSPIMGVPSEHVKTRTVCIYQKFKNAMQSGTTNVGRWYACFDNRQRWENPLMGWISSGDPLSNLDIEFSSRNAAIEHCEKNRWKWFIDPSSINKKPKEFKIREYKDNFSFNKRCRTSTK